MQPVETKMKTWNIYVRSAEKVRLIGIFKDNELTIRSALNYSRRNHGLIVERDEKTRSESGFSTIREEDEDEGVMYSV